MWKNDDHELTFPPPGTSMQPLPCPNSFLQPLPPSNYISLKRHHMRKGTRTFLGRKGGSFHNFLTGKDPAKVVPKVDATSNSNNGDPMDRNLQQATCSSSLGYSMGSQSQSNSNDGLNRQFFTETGLRPIKRRMPTFSNTVNKSSESKDTPPPPKKCFAYPYVALEQSLLLDVTMKIADLIKTSKALDTDIAEYRQMTDAFFRSVLNNQENRHIRDYLLVVSPLFTNSRQQ